MTAITNVTELQAMLANLAGTYWLANDIDASDTVNWNGGAGFVPVGTSASRFTGSFDGAGFTISGLFINRPSTDFVGLFGRTGSPSVLKDVTLSDVNITGQAFVGGFCGVNDNGISGITVSSGSVTGGASGSGQATGGVSGGQFGNGASTDCHSAATVTNNGSGTAGGLFGQLASGTLSQSSASGDVTTTNRSGGLIGFHSGVVTVSDCYATGDVAGSSDVGGLVGSSQRTIRRCYATGDVSATVSAPTVMGGLVGRTSNLSDIDDCYSTGNVSGNNGSWIGGFVGYVPTGSSVDKCYSTGTATGTGTSGTKTGGFVGAMAGGTVVDCFWDTQTSGNATDGEFGTATGKTTAEMTDVATFTDTTTVGLTTAWDFVNNPNDDVANNDYWGIHSTFNGGYPYLAALQTAPTGFTGIGPPRRRGGIR